jgi:hypothetical protein
MIFQPKNNKNGHSSMPKNLAKLETKAGIFENAEMT